MKKNIAFIIFFFIVSTVFAQVINLYPTNWWVGMKWNNVQVLVHADYNISNSKVAIVHPGVTIKKISKFETKNTLPLTFLLLQTQK
jgi:hypothetical protein